MTPASDDDERTGASGAAATRVPLPTGGRRAARDFDHAPVGQQAAALAGQLDLLDLRDARLSGRVVPRDRGGWDLEGQLTATVDQPCRITLEPVTTRIDTAVARRYRTDLAEPQPGGETEMPQDDALEPVPAAIDLAALLAEELALALPAFPQVPGAEMGSATYAEPGVTPLSDDDVKPLAGLKALRERMPPDD